MAHLKEQVLDSWQVAAAWPARPGLLPPVQSGARDDSAPASGMRRGSGGLDLGFEPLG
jgi:hypothetical protein